MRILRDPISPGELEALLEGGFGDMVRAVVDVRRAVMAVGAELQADEEAALLADGSDQADLWGINLYPAKPTSEWIEFDSVINIRPSRGNRSRDVESPETRSAIEAVVRALVP